MRKITAFNFLTLNGYYKGIEEDISWHIHGDEGNEYSENKLEVGNILLFGRKTYEMMYRFWTSPMAYESCPKVAEQMNKAEKWVLSNSLAKPDWQNSKIISGNAMLQIQQLKNRAGKDIAILGSGSIIAQLTNEGLIDNYEILIDPIAIEQGAALFENINHRLELDLIDYSVFKKSGAVFLTYKRK